MNFITDTIDLEALLFAVDSEGIVGMFIGRVASIWFGVGKIKELIEKP